MEYPYLSSKNMHAQKALNPDHSIRVAIMDTIMPIQAEQAVTIDTIMEMTRAMDEASSSGQWDVVTDVEQKRQPFIKTYFGDLSQLVDGAESTDKLQQLIQKILTTDLQIMQRADTARTAVSKELQSISKGQRASQAYIQNQV